MEIQILAVGGYNEVGRNMTAIKIGDEVYICDMGLHIENYIKYTEDEDIVHLTAEELIKADAIPNDTVLGDWKDKVKAIIPTHAHLDHIGGVPFLAPRYRAEILLSPFSQAVLTRILRDGKLTLRNPIKKINVNASYQPTDNVSIQFINMTHSTPQTYMVAFKTPLGSIVYANDFKFDSYPTLGQKPNYEKLEAIGKEGVLALIVDSTYSREACKTPSESVAKQMLKDVLLSTESKNKLVVVTTFSSHIARLRSIIEMGKQLNRKIIFIGRSLGKYAEAAEEAGIINLSEDAEIIKYKSQMRRRLRKILPSKRGKYLFVVTGHQGEPRSVLSRLANDALGFSLEEGDHIVFSCKVIPTDITRANRLVLEQKLMEKKVRIFRDIHVSGHAAKEDLRDLITLLKPRYIIPAHGDETLQSGVVTLAHEMGYRDEHILHLRNGSRATLKPKVI